MHKDSRQSMANCVVPICIRESAIMMLSILWRIWKYLYHSPGSRLTYCLLGTILVQRCHLNNIRNPVVQIWPSNDRLISTTGFAILAWWYFVSNKGALYFFGMRSLSLGERDLLKCGGDIHVMFQICLFLFLSVKACHAKFLNCPIWKKYITYVPSHNQKKKT